MKNEKKVDIEQANKVYFKSLANTRASSAMMINSWTGVFLFAFEILCFYSYDVSKGIKPFSHWFFDILVIYCLYHIIAFFLPLMGQRLYSYSPMQGCFYRSKSWACSSLFLLWQIRNLK